MTRRTPLAPIYDPDARRGAIVVGNTPGTPLPEPMILHYDTTLSAAPNTISPILGGTVDVVVDWGDGNSDSYTTTGTKSHTYSVAGTYTVRVFGTLGGFSNGGSFSVQRRLVEVESWGALGLTSLASACIEAQTLTSVPSTLPATVTDIGSMFRGCDAFNQDISGWDTSAVTSMFGTFFQTTTFNQPIGSWDTSSVGSMVSMFSGASAFNQDISGWDTSAVTDMDSMFNNADAFNQPIGGWNTSAVMNMRFMFIFNGAFNQDISGWDVSAVTNMEQMFRSSVFNQDISGWDVSAVTNMVGMFQNHTTFNQDLSGWCVTPIPSLPSNFDTGATAWVLPRPVWGTCP